MQTISRPTSLTQTDIVRSGGNDLAAINALPEAPTTFIPLAAP